MPTTWHKLQRGIRWFSRKDTLKKEDKTKNGGILVDPKFQLATGLLLKSSSPIRPH